MPFYEYKCDRCGHQFEVMQRINAEPIADCERCHAPVRRVIFPSAIVYKGSGFYSTEYGRSRFNNPDTKSSDGKKTGESPSEASPSAPAATSSSSETAPAAAPQAAPTDATKPPSSAKSASGTSAS